MNLKEHVPLASLTTFEIGGPARYFSEVVSEDELREVASFAKEKDLPLFVLGGGSNILVSDEGFPGLVIKNSVQGISEVRDGAAMRVTIGAGEEWDKVAKWCAEKEYAGIECLSGIPGSTGAAPVQNIGAYGQELTETLLEVRVLDLESGGTRTLSKEECDLSYRNSVFKRNSGRYAITSITLSLTQGASSRYDYRDSRFRISDFFKDLSRPPTLSEVRRAVLEVRAQKGMVIMPEYESYRSAGSFFKIPIVSKNYLERIERIVTEEDEAKAKSLEPWHWELADGQVKVSSAFLLEFTPFNKTDFYASGLDTKSLAAISPKHTLSIINRGGAKASDIISLARKMREAVYEKFGVAFEPEVRLVGFKGDPLQPVRD